MTFALPHLLYFLLAFPLLAGLRFWADWRAAQAVKQLTAPRLREGLLAGHSPARSWLIFSLQMLALACYIVALAQPRWGEDKIVQQESGRNVLIAIDTSRSMLANDVVPDRMTRAKLAAQDVLATLRTDRVGLIAFAGNAYLQAPLTTDHDAVIEAIQALDFSSVPRGGSDIGRALKLAMETFEKSPARNHGLILFSDGGEPDATIIEYTKQAAKKNVLVLTVGVGTDAGSLIPDPDPERAGDYVRDNQGAVVKTRLEPNVLQEIATATRGRYLKLGSQPLAASVVRDLLSALQAQTNAAKELVRPVERYHWPLSIGTLLLMIAWLIRPSSRFMAAPRYAAALIPLAFLNPAPAQAGVLGVLFGNERDGPEAARTAYQGGDYKKAATLYGDLVKQEKSEEVKHRYAFGLGSAAHQLKDYDKAVGAFSSALQSTVPAEQGNAHRGIAHSLYEQGEATLVKQPPFTLRAWRDSVKHFDAALVIDPENKEVKENRDFVQKRLDELQQAMDQQQKKGKGKKGDKQKGQKGQKGEEGEEGEDEDGESGQNGDEKEDGEGGDEEKSRKESLGKKEGEEKEDALPEGQVQAGKEGEPKEGKQQQAGHAENDPNEATGFSRNEARAFLRTYADDQKKAQQLRPRDPPPNGKDW